MDYSPWIVEDVHLIFNHLMMIVFGRASADGPR